MRAIFQRKGYANEPIIDRASPNLARFLTPVIGLPIDPIDRVPTVILIQPAVISIQTVRLVPSKKAPTVDRVLTEPISFELY